MAEGINEDELSQGAALDEIDEVTDTTSHDHTNRGGDRKRNVTGRDRSFFLCFLVREVHTVQERFHHLLMQHNAVHR